jgi:hypothetical protein
MTFALLFATQLLTAMLQAQKRDQEESPNPFNLLAPQIAIPKRTLVGWYETKNGAGC